MTGDATARAAYLTGLIGRRWSPGASCWHLACEVEASLWGRHLPAVEIPDAVTWRWMVDTLAAHPERQRWRELPPNPAGLVAPSDGALVLMARVTQGAHVGIWLHPEGRVLHADAEAGVALDAMVTLRARGWARLRFFEPI
ncbi:hypothetical protein V5F79_03220 [Xanthobacter flavus]|uniref:hypothetical protein n=1 Tax=Xanthobacter flavus TaxID=281 RepID=UPI00372A5211